MKAITIKQPWASLIVHGIKDIENRSWKTNYRGKILIHAAAKPARIELSMPGQATVKEIAISSMLNEVEEDNLFSCIIGEVEIIDCVKGHSSIWAEEGVYNWVLANPLLYDQPILNLKGKLRFWNY